MGLVWLTVFMQFACNFSTHTMLLCVSGKLAVPDVVFVSGVPTMCPRGAACSVWHNLLFLLRCCDCEVAWCSLP